MPIRTQSKPGIERVDPIPMKNQVTGSPTCFTKNHPPKWCFYLLSNHSKTGFLPKRRRNTQVQFPSSAFECQPPKPSPSWGPGQSSDLRRRGGAIRISDATKDKVVLEDLEQRSVASMAAETQTKARGAIQNNMVLAHSTWFLKDHPPFWVAMSRATSASKWQGSIWQLSEWESPGGEICHAMEGWPPGAKLGSLPTPRSRAVAGRSHFPRPQRGWKKWHAKRALPAMGTSRNFPKGRPLQIDDPRCCFPECGQLEAFWKPATEINCCCRVRLRPEIAPASVGRKACISCRTSIW